MFRDNAKAHHAVYDSDECSVTVRSSKDGIQFAFTGCPTHAMVLVTLLALHQQTVFEEKVAVNFSDPQKLHAKLLLAQIGMIAEQLLIDPSEPKKKPKKKKGE